MDRGDYSRVAKEVRTSNTPSSRDSMEFKFRSVEGMVDGVEENEREGRWKEGGQGMEVIEKTRWKGDKTVGVEIVRTRMKRGMDEMKRV